MGRKQKRARSKGSSVSSPQSDSSELGSLQSFVERNVPPVVGVTYWFDPPAAPAIQTATIRLTGERLGRTGPPRGGDKFTHEETIDGIVGGGGPVAVTMKVRDITPGDWKVDARLLPTQNRNSHTDRNRPTPPLNRAAWSWRRWRLTPAPATPVPTRLLLFVRPPAVILGSWAALVVLGILLALIVQGLVISAADLTLTHVLPISLISLLGGIIGGKVWYVILHRRDGQKSGWAVQGFVAGFALVAPPLLLIFNVPVGDFLDASTPGLLLGLAVGRLGCFFTGCCAGRPSASRWAVWSSNRSVGARRIPTQIMESALGFTLALIALVLFLRFGSQHGTFFIAAIASYTIIRQRVLLLRDERRQSNRGASFVALLAALIFVGDLVTMIWTWR
ncbi:MAG: prolipoprotein diacylglyceryl transferase [Actinobacteria bacterium]|nr:prolipoprotein diacylglyceryl transferase [Actinomycetota bacterium]